MKTPFLALLLASATLAAAKTPTVNIKVVDSTPGSRNDSFMLPGSSGPFGYYPPTIYNTTVPQMDVHAIMPNGIHVTLWCQTGFHQCANLLPGDYPAEIKGNSFYVHTNDFGGKEHKIKYHAVGTW
jgi:hypothetical protein